MKSDAEISKRDLHELSRTLTKDPLGLLWAGPEKAGKLRAAARNTAKFGQLGLLLGELDPAAEVFVVALPKGPRYWPMSPELVGYFREGWERMLRLGIGLPFDAACEASGFRLPVPGHTLAEVIAEEDAP